MTPVETELSRVLNEAAPEPPEGSGPRELGSLAPRRRVLPVAAAAMVLVIAAVAVATSRSHSPGTPAAQTHPTTPPPAPPAPAGMISVGYFGITVTVPKTFGVGPYFCIPPLGNTVVPETGETVSCPMIRSYPPPDPHRIVVYLRPRSAGTNGIRANHATAVDGVRALTGDSHDSSGRPASVLVIPRNRVIVEVIAQSYADTHRVLRNVHIAPVDTHGCVDRAAPLTSTSNSAANTILPGRPQSAMACEYTADYRLIGSGSLSAQQLRHVIAALDGAHPSTPDRGVPPLRVRYLFKYADGTSRTVDADLDYDPFTATDGRHVVSSSKMTLPRAYA